METDGAKRVVTFAYDEVFTSYVEKIEEESHSEPTLGQLLKLQDGMSAPTPGAPTEIFQADKNCQKVMLDSNENWRRVVDALKTILKGN